MYWFGSFLFLLCKYNLLVRAIYLLHIVMLFTFTFRGRTSLISFGKSGLINSFSFHRFYLILEGFHDSFDYEG